MYTHFCSMFINTFGELAFEINKINAEHTYDQMYHNIIQK